MSSSLGAAIHRRFVDRFAGAESLPVSWRWVSLTTPPFPPFGSQRAQFPEGQRYYEGATTSQPRINGRLFVSLPPTTTYLLGWCLAEALLDGRRCRPGRGSCSAGTPIIRLLVTWTRLGSLRSPGDPSRAFAAFLDPGRTDVSSSIAATSMLPPRSGRRGLRH
jgi:hypothetical protein